MLLKSKSLRLWSTVLFFLLIIIISSNVISAEITSINPDVINQGDTIRLTIRPTRAGFYNIIYVYKDTNLIDLINVNCQTICERRKRIDYVVPADFFGEYYFATFDYAIEDYELDYFNVIEQGGAPDGELTILGIGNIDSGTNWIIYPEQGQNANITIVARLNVRNCQNYNVNAYLCNSSTSCSETSYTHKVTLQLQDQIRRRCWFNTTTAEHFPFYQQADDWKIFAKSGIAQDQRNFTYSSLMAISYPGMINFGALNAMQWNIGVPQTAPDLINHGNLPLLIEWNSNGFACVSENCTDFWQASFQGEDRFQIDDDNLFLEENETGLIPEFITNYSMNFFPQSNLSVCLSSSCNDSIGERTKTFFNLKIPQIQRGNYQGDIVISLY